MALTALLLLPEYSGDPWEALPNLRRGARELAALLEEHAAEVRSPAFTSIDELTQALADGVRDGGDPLLVYVGGHGIVHARRHYTALDATPPHAPSSRDGLWSATLGELLAGRGRDVLVVLDTCFAGEGAVGIIEEAVSALADLPDARAFGVVASCRAFEPAQDGVFVETLLGLVRDGPRHDINAWTTGDRWIRTGALASELRHAGLQVTGNLEAGELRLIPNPRWNADELEGRVDVRAALRRLSRDAGTHLIDKSAGFVGRANVRREVVAWLASEPRGTFVVTGGPGTGKSALMGLLARQSVGDPVAVALDDVPAVVPGTFDVIVHARQKTLAAVREELSAATARDAPLTVLVDALDEAVSGEALGIAAHLASLARRGAAAIVVGTRPGPVVARHATAEDALLRELAPQVLYELNEDHTLEADIAAMVRAHLLDAQDSPYRGADVPIDEIAELAAAITTPSFLFAQATARWLCSRDTAISDEPDWQERLKRSTGEAGLGRLVEDDLAARFPADVERVRDLLRSAAWAEGLGLPRYTIWPSFANELSPADASYSDPDVTWLLNEAGWYLTESSEDGQSVYRLFHQALTDHFRAGTPGAPEDVQARLAARLHRIATTAGGWERADPYILHYLVAHAEQSADDGAAPSGAPALLGDPEFVAHADADRLARAVRRLRGRIRGPLGPLLERCVHLLGGLPPPQRLALLELTALQEQLADPGVAAGPGGPWWPVWARWRSSVPHLTLPGHGGPVESAAFSPDGTTLASASNDHTVKLWNTATCQPTHTLTGHHNWVHSVAFAPDGTLLASASADRTVKLWDTTTGQPAHTLTGHDGWVSSVAFSPDGTTLASASNDETVRIWDSATGQPIRALTSRYGVSSVAFSPDGTTLATAGTEGDVGLWDIITGQPTHTLRSHHAWVASVVFSPDGATLASASGDHTIKLWVTATTTPTRTLTGHDDWVRAVAFSPDGTTLASTGDDRTIKLWNATTGQPTHTLTGHDDSVRSVAFSPDGVTLASASKDHTVRLWDTTTGRPTHTFTGHRGWVWSVAFSPDGAALASASNDGTIRIWDAATGRHTHMLTIGNLGFVSPVAFSPDGTTLATAGTDGEVSLWEATTGRLIDTLTGHRDSVWSVAFSPDGATLATAGVDHTVRLWSAGTGRCTHTLTGHNDWVRAVAFSPDGAMLASASNEGDVRLWDAITGEPLARVTARSACNGVAWSSQARLAIAADEGIAVIDVR
jgi:WD40 repeat protein